MPLMKHNKRLNTAFTLNLRNVWLNLIMLILIIYFCYHSLSGQRGFLAYLKLNKDIKHSSYELNQLQIERAEIENKVRLLYPNTLDMDILDEIARREMGLVGKEEKVIILGN
jgi:cell division protein FtsB